MTRKQVSRLLHLLWVTFATMIVAGIILIFISTSADAQPNSTKPTPTEIDISATKDAAKVKVKTTSGGVVLVAIGGLGAILLLIKLPVQWVTPRKRPNRDQGGQIYGFSLGMMGDMLSPELSAPEGMPVLLWWLVKSRAPLVRAESQ